MSLGIFGSVGRPYLHTMMPIRPLLVIYFDGQSASPTGTGTFDTQTALLKDYVPLHPSVDFIYNEHQRALELCQLAESLKVDGIVRMNAGFEVLICDYVRSAVQEIHSVNITVPGNKDVENNPNLPRDPNRQPPHGIGNAFAEQNGWEWARSGVWHYGGLITGGGSLREARVQPDFCGMVSFYDPYLRSLSGEHHGGIRGNDTYQNGWGLRRGHRLLGVSKFDIVTVRHWIQQAVMNARSQQSWFGFQRSRCSMTNWQMITETIVDQHKTRGKEIMAALNNHDKSDLDAVVQKVHELSHAILYPYIEYPGTVDQSLDVVRSQAILRCSSVYTGHILLETLSDLEKPLKNAIEYVLHSLCNWEWSLFEWSERRTTDLLIFQTAENGSSDKHHEELFTEIKRFKEQTANIIKWIGWDLWQDCETKCSWDVSSRRSCKTSRAELLLRRYVIFQCIQ